MLCLKSKRGERMFWGVGMAVVSTTSWRCRGADLGASWQPGAWLPARCCLTLQR